MKYVMNEMTRLEDAISHLGVEGVEIGHCRCNECKRRGVYDTLGPTHFYFGEKCLGYVLHGTYHSFYNHSMILDEERHYIHLAELIKKDIEKL